MKIYDSDGWLNWNYLFPENKFIMAITGPRGTGKTFGLLKYIADNNLRFIYMRRLRAQLDNAVSGPENNPFKAVNTYMGRSITPEKQNGTVCFIDDASEEIMGYGVALSTVATIRGSDFSDVDVIVFDEFIAMAGERPIKDEVAAFYNFIETVNRNRELSGRDPVKCFLLGNANKLMNPYYLEWHFMKTALRMIRGDQMMWRSQDDNLIMVLLLHSPISDKKRDTALYRIAGGDFVDMALDNAFATDATKIGTRKLTDCRHIVSIGSIGIYQLKSTGEHYVSETINRSYYLQENEINLTIFRTRFLLLKSIYLAGFIRFENYDCELLFRAYIGL